MGVGIKWYCYAEGYFTPRRNRGIWLVRARLALSLASNYHNCVTILDTPFSHAFITEGGEHSLRREKKTKIYERVKITIATASNYNFTFTFSNHHCVHSSRPNISLFSCLILVRYPDGWWYIISAQKIHCNPLYRIQCSHPPKLNHS